MTHATRRTVLGLLLVMAAACGSEAPPPATPPNPTVGPGRARHDIYIVAHQSGPLGQCRSLEQPGPTHLKSEDVVVVEFRNACKNKYEFRMQPADMNRQLFEQRPPYTRQVAGQYSEFVELTVRGGAPTGEYKYDVYFRGEKFDPKFVIDP